MYFVCPISYMFVWNVSVVLSSVKAIATYSWNTEYRVPNNVHTFSLWMTETSSNCKPHSEYISLMTIKNVCEEIMFICFFYSSEGEMARWRCVEQRRHDIKAYVINKIIAKALFISAANGNTAHLYFGRSMPLRIFQRGVLSLPPIQRIECWTFA